VSGKPSKLKPILGVGTLSLRCPFGFCKFIMADFKAIMGIYGVCPPKKKPPRKTWGLSTTMVPQLDLFTALSLEGIGGYPEIHRDSPFG